MKKRTIGFIGLLAAMALVLSACRAEQGEVITTRPQTVSALQTTAPSSSQTTATATTQSEVPEVPISGPWQWDPYRFDLLSGDYRQSAEKLADAIMAYAPTVTLEKGQAAAVCENFAFEFPPAALVDLSAEGDEVRITYLYDRQTHAEKLTAFENAVENALNSSVETEDSELERALMLYRYVVSNVRYFTVDFTEKETTAFSALTEGVTICYGFADAFGYLLRQTGMEAHLYRGARSDGAEHGWTYAEIDGKWYHFDPTWDGSNYKNTGILWLSYFGMNDDRRYRGLLKQSEYGFGELLGEGEVERSPEWLLPEEFYPYSEWTYHRETGELRYKQGSLILENN